MDVTGLDEMRLQEEMIQDGLLNEDLSLTPLGELRFHQLKQAKWWAEHPRKQRSRKPVCG